MAAEAGDVVVAAAVPVVAGDEVVEMNETIDIVHQMHCWKAMAEVHGPNLPYSKPPYPDSKRPALSPAVATGRLQDVREFVQTALNHCSD